MKAKYCKCKNTYSIKCSQGLRDCKTPYYWFQGIGKTRAILLEGIFDDSFDNTFN
jgi:hypothetical protein